MKATVSHVEIHECRTAGGMRYFDIVQMVKIGDRHIAHRGHEDWPRSRAEAMAMVRADLPGVPVVLTQPA